MELFRIFDKILGERINYEKLDMRIIITTIQKIIRDFIFVLSKNPNLAFFTFVWKKRIESYQLHPSEVSREVSFNEFVSSTPAKKAKEPKKAAAPTVTWTPIEDNQLRELFETYKKYP